MRGSEGRDASDCRAEARVRERVATSQNVFVASIGMIPFTEPGSSGPYPVMGATAVLADAGIGCGDVEQAWVG